MKHTTKIKMLDVEAVRLGVTVVVHPVLFQDDDGVTLVDTIYPGQFDRLQRAMEKVGVNPKQVRRIVLTHQDIDHIGAMRELIELCGENLTIYAHAVEKPYIEGTRLHAKLTPERIAARLQALPEENRLAAAAMFAAIPTFRVHCAIQDGDVLPFHGGIRVIHTPGHTPGHVCLFLTEQRTLIPGDELRVEKGRLVGPSQENTLNVPEALRSMKKLLGLNIEHVYAFHGGYHAGDISAVISELAGQ